MNHVIAKIRIKGNALKYRKILSDEILYTLPQDLSPHIPYSPNHNLDEDAWFGINNFSQQSFCLDVLKENFVSTAYDMLESCEINKLDFLCAVQDKNYYYFQKLSKTQLLSRKKIYLGDRFKFSEDSKDIVINDVADTIYIKDIDILYFKKLSSITGIFKGIDDLYREATEEETRTFLESEFIQLSEEFNAAQVKQANRKRIAMAIDIVNSFEAEQKEIVFDTIKDYCPDLVAENGAFKIASENDLKLLLYGIDQRFYTTPDGKEKRIANSGIKLNPSTS
jgi:hypothetical protein